MKKTIDMLQNKKNVNRTADIIYRGLMVILVLIFCTRIFGLDKDLPAYGLGGYNAPDEGLYGFMGLNLYNYGSLTPTVQLTDYITVSTYTAYHLRTNIIMNYMIYYCMKLFGDNYFGFRLSIVLISLINYLLIIHITSSLVKRYGNNYEKDRWLTVIVSTIFAFCFPFLISSRVVEPTIFRMTFALLAYNAFINSKKVETKYFWSSFYISLSVQLVYITNIFLFFPVVLSGFLNLKTGKNKSFLRAFTSAIVGGVTAVTLCAVYYHLAWKSNFVLNTLNTVHSFGQVNGYQSAATGGLKAFVATLCDFWGSNAFLFNIPVMVSFLILLPKLTYSAWMRIDETLMFTISSVIGLFFQTLITNDYIFRKGILILPFSVFSLLIYYLNRDECSVNLKKIRFLPEIYRLVVCAFLLVILYYRLFSSRVGTSGDFSTVLKCLIVLEGLLAIGCALAPLFAPEYHQRKFAIVVLCYSLLVNVVCCCKYVLLNESYLDKNAMLSLTNYNDHVVFGAYSYGYTLYNDIKPVLLLDEEYRNLFKDYKKDFYYIDVSTENGDYVEEYFEKWLFHDTQYGFYTIKNLPRSFAIDGQKIDFALYGLDLKANIELIDSDLEEQLEKLEQQERLFAVASEAFQIKRDYSDDLGIDMVHFDATQAINFNNELNTLYEEYELNIGQIYEIENGVNSNVICSGGKTNRLILGDVYGDINASVEYPICGDVYGDIHGDVNSEILGNVYGRIYGNINATIGGVVYGE